MKNLILLFALAFGFVNLNASNNAVNIKKLGETSASFVVNSDKSRTVLVLYPTTEMLPQLDLSKKLNLTTESVDLSKMKPIKNNVYVVFDGVQSAIPLTIKGLKASSGYMLTMLKPEVKDFKQIDVEFATVAPEPKSQAKGLAFRQPTENAIGLLWANGDGEGRILVVSKGDKKIELPQDGKEYKPGKFGEASAKIGEHSYVVFSGKKNEFKIENLEAATMYNFQLFEFNGTGKSTNYLTESNSGSARSKMTAIPAPEVLPAKDVHEIGFTASWKSKGKVEKYLIDIAYDEAFTKFAETYENADVGNIEEIEVIDLDKNKPWFFRVRALGDGTMSPNSKTLKVKE